MMIGKIDLHSSIGAPSLSLHLPHTSSPCLQKLLTIIFSITETCTKSNFLAWILRPRILRFPGSKCIGDDYKTSESLDPR